jgi:hypothetical protein
MRVGAAAVLAVVTVVTSLASAPVFAGSGWGPPQILSSGDNPADTKLASDRRGRITAVQSIRVDQQDQLIARHMTSSGALQDDAQNVTGLERVIPAYDLALDDDGDAVVVWQIYTGDQIQWQVFARRISRTGELGPVVRISNPVETSSLNGVAVAPDGMATIVYQRGITEGESATVVVRLRRNSSLGGRTYLPFSDHPPRPVASRSGHVAFALSGTPDLTARAVRVAPDGQIRMRQLTSDLAGDDGTADVDVDRHGNVYAVVARHDWDRAWVRTWRRDGSLGTARRISPPAEQAPYVLIRTDLEGDSVVLWSRYHEDHSLRVSGRWWSGELGPLHRLGKMDGATSVTLELPSWSASIDDDGDAVLAWEIVNLDAGGERLHVTRVTRSGRFTDVRDLGRGLNASTMTTPGGRDYLTYFRNDNFDDKVLLRIHD